ncbi:unnamed protein product, partial [Staurois parvus]
MVWWIHPTLYQQFRLVVSWCGGSILPCINGSSWWCHGVVDPSYLVSTVQAGGVMVWGIHPALYQWFRLVVSWCGGSILPCNNGSGWWCHGVVDPSCLVSTVQADGVMVWGIHPTLYQRFRLVVSWCGGSILPCINGSGWWCLGVVDASYLVSTVQAGGVMVWCIHPALYQRFRLVVSWCGVSILPCINGSGWWCWWCLGVVDASYLVSTVQAGG